MNGIDPRGDDARHHRETPPTRRDGVAADGPEVLDLGPLGMSALEYAQRGWAVLPLRARGKAPLGALVPNGLHGATTNLDRVRSWWRRSPDANIGLRTGIAFDVVDIDGPAGRDALNAVGGRRPTAPGPKVRTGSGGWHLYHLPTGQGNRTGLLHHVDFRGRDGYVVAPPSIHPNGTPYRWQQEAGPDEPLEPLAEWLSDLVVFPRPSARAPRNATPLTGGYGQRVLESAVGRIVLAPIGQRNSTLNAESFALGQLVGAGKVPVTAAVAALLHAACLVDLGEDETVRTVMSGLSGGMRSPRRWGRRP